MSFRCQVKVIILFYFLFFPFVFANGAVIPSKSIEAETTKSLTLGKEDYISLEKNIYDKVLLSISERGQLSTKKMSDLESIINGQKKLIESLQEKVSQQSSQGDAIDKLQQQTSEYEDNQASVSFVEFAGIALTSVAVLVAILGIVIAGFSFWGYKSIKDSTDETATKIATDVATETVKNDIPDIVKYQLITLINEGKLNKNLEDAVDMIMRKDRDQYRNLDQDIFAEIDEEQASSE